jgi:hypothetical protein
VKGLGRAAIVVLSTIVAAGCGMSTAVSGTPVAAVRIPTIDKPTTPASPSPTVQPSATSEPPSSTSSAESTPPNDPAAVVQAYFDAINARDYQRAWDLGGKNVGQSYAAFTKGFATTDHDVLTVQSVQDNTVTADLVAVQVDGTKRSFHGVYTVTDGTITRFSVRATG